MGKALLALLSFNLDASDLTALFEASAPLPSALPTSASSKAGGISRFDLWDFEGLGSGPTLAVLCDKAVTWMWLTLSGRDICVDKAARGISSCSCEVAFQRYFD